jgi:signal-transduction protein with cAMP-binding, CBS, and nucleotidyltransferase domain
MVVDAQAGHPVGIITEADIAHAIADGKDVNDVWVDAVMIIRPAVTTTTKIRDTATIMTTRHFRHLPVAGDTGLLGLVDITDVCRALPAAEQGSLRDPRCSKLPTEVTGPDCDKLARRDAAPVSHVQPVKQDA